MNIRDTIKQNIQRSAFDWDLFTHLYNMFISTHKYIWKDGELVPKYNDDNDYFYDNHWEKLAEEHPNNLMIKAMILKRNFILDNLDGYVESHNISDIFMGGSTQKFPSLMTPDDFTSESPIFNIPDDIKDDYREYAKRFLEYWCYMLRVKYVSIGHRDFETDIAHWPDKAKVLIRKLNAQLKALRTKADDHNDVVMNKIIDEVLKEERENG